LATKLGNLTSATALALKIAVAGETLKRAEILRANKLKKALSTKNNAEYAKEEANVKK